VDLGQDLLVGGVYRLEGVTRRRVHPLVVDEQLGVMNLGLCVCVCVCVDDGTDVSVPQAKAKSKSNSNQLQQFEEMTHQSGKSPRSRQAVRGRALCSKHNTGSQATISCCAPDCAAHHSSWPKGAAVQRRETKPKEQP
jgi:hypothetical protein